MACGQKQAHDSESTGLNQAGQIYFGGDIFTMEGDCAVYVEAVVVKDGKIVMVGSEQESQQ